MVKIKILGKDLLSVKFGTLLAGQVAEVPEHFAAWAVKNGYAENVSGQPAKKKAAKK
jgi:hypothetical protein